jgi:hypothetical protein
MSWTLRGIWASGLVVVLTLLLGVPAQAAGSFTIERASLAFGGEAVDVTVGIACDPMPPNSWASVGLFLEQGKFTARRHVQGFGNFGAIGSFGLDCDGSFHSYGFEVVPTDPFADRTFRSGPARYEATVSICTLVDPTTETYHCEAPDGLYAGKVHIAPKI